MCSVPHSVWICMTRSVVRLHDQPVVNIVGATAGARIAVLWSLTASALALPPLNNKVFPFSRRWGSIYGRHCASPKVIVAKIQDVAGWLPSTSTKVSGEITWVGIKLLPPPPPEWQVWQPAVGNTQGSAAPELATTSSSSRTEHQYDVLFVFRRPT